MKIVQTAQKKDSAEDKYKRLLRARFADMALCNTNSNKELLGIVLRDDLFMKLLSNDEEEIRLIWKKMIGEDEHEEIKRATQTDKGNKTRDSNDSRRGS